jgi:hypothetical protein
MIKLGIEFKGSMARLVFVTLDNNNDIKDISFAKADIGEGNSKKSIIDFKATVENELIKHKPDSIAIKSRASKGGFAGGSKSFKMEAIVQLLAKYDVVFVAPQTVTKKLKSSNSKMLDVKMTKIDEGAFISAIIEFL